MTGLNVGVSFITSLASLAVLVWALWHWFRHTPDLVVRLEGIRQYVSRKLRVDKAQAALQKARVERAGVQRLLERARRLWEDRIFNDEGAMVTAITFGVVTVVTYLGDCALLILLNGSAAVLGYTFTVWACLAPWVGAAVFISFHTLAHLAISDPDRPGVTLRRARIGALLSGLVVVLGFWATLYGRGADFATNGWAADTIQIGLWLLTLALAVCGALTALIATTSLGEARIGKRTMELEGLDEAYARFLEALQAEIDAYSVDPSPAPVVAAAAVPSAPNQRATAEAAEVEPDTPSASATLAFNKAKMIFFAALITTLGVAGTAHAQVRSQVARSTPAAAGVLRDGVPAAGAQQKVESFEIPQWLARPGVPVPDSCEFLLDSSGSMGETGRASAASVVARLLPAAVDAYGCRIVRLSAFSDSPFQTIQEFEIPPMATDHSSSPCPSVGTDRGAMVGVARRLYPNYDASLKQDDQQGCAEIRRQEERRAADARAQAVGNAATAFEGLGTLGAQGTCTAIYQVTARALTRSAHVIDVTDDQQSCGWYRSRDGAPLAVSIPTSSSLMFLVVPTASDRGPDVAIARADAVRGVFPGSLTVLLNEATPAFWQQLAAMRAR